MALANAVTASIHRSVALMDVEFFMECILAMYPTHKEKLACDVLVSTVINYPHKNSKHFVLSVLQKFPNTFNHPQLMLLSAFTGDVLYFVNRYTANQLVELYKQDGIPARDGIVELLSWVIISNPTTTKDIITHAIYILDIGVLAGNEYLMDKYLCIDNLKAAKADNSHRDFMLFFKKFWTYLNNRPDCLELVTSLLTPPEYKPVELD